MPVKKSAKKVVKKTTQQKMVDFNTAVKRFWTKYAEFDGTAQRSEYWFTVLFLFLVEMAFTVLTSAIPFVGLLYWVWSLAIIIPCLSLSARRLHDAGFSAKWLVAFWACLLFGFGLVFLGKFTVMFFLLSELLLIASGIIGIFLFITSLLPSKFKDNKYRR